MAIEQNTDTSAKNEAAANSADVGITQIDGSPATSVRFERKENADATTYNLTFIMDKKSVARLNDLNIRELSNAVGKTNALSIMNSAEGKGILSGSALANEYGLSPEESARRTTADEERKLADFDRLRADELSEKNIVENDATIEIEREKRQQDHVRQSVAPAETKNDVEQKIDGRQGPDIELTDENANKQEKIRQAALMAALHQQFRVSGAKYHFKDQPTKVAFTDKGERIVSSSNDERAAQAMAKMSEAKGWKSIRVSGHPDFQREVWIEASIRGIEVRGFKPNEKEIAELEMRREREARNIVERVSEQEQKHKAEQVSPISKSTEQTASTDASKSDSSQKARIYTGRLLEHGSAPYGFDSKEKMNYFVKLETVNGPVTLWGDVLKRAITERKSKIGDELRLELQGFETKGLNSKDSDKYKVVGAVAAEVLKEKIKDPVQREEIMKAINQRMAERAKVGKVPTVPIYDKNAPSTTAQTERTRPQVNRRAERSR
jgi:hypothetical protein